jgi:DNA-binding transcriptional MerR regulator
VGYTVSDVIKATGLKRRTVQFWADEEVIQATKATQEGGQGVHRSFTRNELIVACLIHPLSLGWHRDQTRSLGELNELARALRHLLKTSVTRDDFDSAIAGKGRFYLILTWVFGGGIVTAVENASRKEKPSFPGVIGHLETEPGRCEILYLNEWLEPLRSM